MKRFFCILGLTAALLAVGCADEALPVQDHSAPETAPGVDVEAASAACFDATGLAPGVADATGAAALDAYPTLEADMEALKARLEGRRSMAAKTGNVVEVPPGSSDALADAIAQAGPGGTVLLRSGDHWESGTVEVTRRVEIVGERSAVLWVDTEPADPGEMEVKPGGAALYVHDAAHVVVWGVEIRPMAEQGGAAVLVEEAPHTVIGENDIRGFQFSIFVRGGDHTRIWNNTVVTTPRSPDLHPFVPIGITSAAGSHVQIAGNDVSNGITGIFVSGAHGLLAHNESHGNVLGVVFCNFGSMPGPGGEIRAEIAATRWVAQHNDAYDNLFVGYYVYDGANNNLLANNAASGNGAWDMELTAEQPRPGLPPAPASFDNHVVAGRYEDITIKDCGINNTIEGGNQLGCF